jgi:ABC-2 type transport system permease protein
MVPQFAMPVFMQRFADVSPMHWGLEALLTVLLRGGGVVDALPWLARLGGFGLLTGGVAWLLLLRSRQ